MPRKNFETPTEEPTTEENNKEGVEAIEGIGSEEKIVPEIPDDESLGIDQEGLDGALEGEEVKEDEE